MRCYHRFEGAGGTLTSPGAVREHCSGWEGIQLFHGGFLACPLTRTIRRRAAHQKMTATSRPSTRRGHIEKIRSPSDMFLYTNSWQRWQAFLGTARHARDEGVEMDATALSLTCAKSGIDGRYEGG